MPKEKAETICLFSDIVSLLYHEARNVRHLIVEGHLPQDTPFRSLRDGLAVNRVEAWRQMQPLRRRAASAQSAQGAEMVFQKQFSLTLEHLAWLYEHPGWKGTPYGGNAWLPIAQRAIRLRELIDGGQGDDAVQLARAILQSQHNTGGVGEKLERLDAHLTQAPE